MSPSRELFISHASEDADIAEILATTIRRTTLEQLRVWFSSDNETRGGIRPGEIWTQTLFKRLRSCDLLLTVVTPNSLGSWSDRTACWNDAFRRWKRSEIGRCVAG